ncbi:hypothetical protein [Blautia hansenii]|uniref:Uncharacterized protein n=1 Tax=Blautia hansenii DSM 20583 TaxID=537007 RepID=C9L792_BLAHA|nr:hypothetical protein [Blautia hansenii]ASM69927.1 hypothetical protein CGC63_10315 [Blautia hansenii DSM 20583]EEX22286.1 hypothetical protein BLAHAN_05254 [Blautia hansenii DSM 20583]UWO09684.1 hypothetical protein NQ538_10400 [Blautia hansenii DSM 20583]
MENKPMSVILNEVKGNIVNIINQSGLPIYITEMILKDIVNDVSEVSRQVREKEYQDYIQAEQTKMEETKTQKTVDMEKADE